MVPRVGHEVLRVREAGPVTPNNPRRETAVAWNLQDLMREPRRRDPFLPPEDEVKGIIGQAMRDPYAQSEQIVQQIRFLYYMNNGDQVIANEPDRKARVQRKIDALTNLQGWFDDKTELERCGETMVPHFSRALRGDSVIVVADFKDKGEALRARADKFNLNVQSLLVRHDWARAFAGAQDFDGGEIVLPYDHTAFEFVISGHHVIVFAGQHLDTKRIVCTPVVRAAKEWLLFRDPFDLLNPDGEKDRNIASYTTDGKIEFLARQIRAICIALDAEIAEASPVRQVYQGKAKDQADLPSFAYHVVDLSKKRQRSTLPAAGGTHRSPRLHFRRGHWRHYATFKTWVKWTLVGNPDLGYIEKEYRV